MKKIYTNLFTLLLVLVAVVNSFGQVVTSVTVSDQTPCPNAPFTVTWDGTANNQYRIQIGTTPGSAAILNQDLVTSPFVLNPNFSEGTDLYVQIIDHNNGDAITVATGVPFIVNTLPTVPTSATPLTVCANTSFILTAAGGVQGTNAITYWYPATGPMNIGTRLGTDPFTVVAGINAPTSFRARREDGVCGVNSTAFTHSVALITPVNSIGDITGLMNNSKVCEGQNYTLSVAAPSAGQIQWSASSDGGANFLNIGVLGDLSVDQADFALTVNQNTSYAFRAEIIGACNSANNDVDDTLFVSSFINASAFGATTVSLDGTLLSGAVCPGSYALTFAGGNAGNNPATDTTYELTNGIVNNLALATPVVLLSGQNRDVTFTITDACTSTPFSSAPITINVEPKPDTANSIAFTARTNAPAVVVTSQNATSNIPIRTFSVCAGTVLDFAIGGVGATTFGTNGKFIIEKSIDGGLTFSTVIDAAQANIAFGGLGNNIDTVGQNTLYRLAIAYNCDTVPLRTINVVLFNSSSPLASVAVVGGATVTADNKACVGETVMLSATPGVVVGDDSPVVTFFRADDAMGTNPVVLGTSNVLVAGKFVFSTTQPASAIPVFYGAFLSSTCQISPDTVYTSPISTHTISTAPTGVTANPVSPVCSGTDVVFTATGGALGDNGDKYQFRVNAGAWTDTPLNASSATVTVSVNNTVVDFRIFGGCTDVSATTVSSAAIAVTPNPVQPTSVTPSNAGPVCGNTLVTFTANGATLNGGTYEYSLDNSNFTATANSGTDAFIQLTVTANTAVSFRVVGGCNNATPTSATSATVVYNTPSTAPVGARLSADGDMGVGHVGTTCADTLITYTIQGGSLGTGAQYLFEYRVDGGAFMPLTPQSTNSIDLNPSTFGATASFVVRGSIVGGCNNISGTTQNYRVNILGGSTKFNLISADADNFCANIGQSVNLVASGATSNGGATVSVVWYELDDQSVIVGTALQSLPFNDPSAATYVATPVVTTTFGVRIESSCPGVPPTAFEVRTITVKDTSNVSLAAFSPAAPKACPGGLVTVNYNNITLGSGAVVKWYSDAAGLNQIATGPSVALTAPVTQADTTYYVNVVGECNATAITAIVVSQTAVVPNNNFTIDNAGVTQICENGSITLTTVGSDASQESLSHIWAVSKDNGGSYSTIPDGDSSITFSSFFGSNFVNNLATVKFKAQRTNGCTTSAAQIIDLVVEKAPTALTSVTASAATICYNTGVVLTANGGNAGFNGVLRWYAAGNPIAASDDVNPLTVSNILATTVYSARYESASCGVTAGKMVTVTVNPEITNDITSSSVVCANATFSFNTLNGSGVFSNVSPASVRFNAGAQSFDATGLTAGDVFTFTYTRTVSGCSKEFTFTLNVVGFPTIGANAITSVNPNSCSPNGSISINGANVTGGTTPYTYSIGSGYSATTQYNGLSSGTFQVTAKDANACISAAQSVTLTAPGAVAVTRTAADTIINCFNDTTGSVTFAVSGGVAPYTVLLSGKPAKTLAAAGNISFTGIGAGSYNVSVTSSLGCTTTLTNVLVVTTANPANSTPYVIVNSFKNLTCFGGNDGKMELVGAGGQSPYAFKVDTNAFVTTKDFTGLVAKTYSITVKDAGNCQRSFVYTLTQPTEIMLDTTLTFVSNSQGYTVVVSATGGTGVKEFSVDNGLFTSNTDYLLPTGEHTISAKDESGCTKTITFVLSTVGVKTVNTLNLSVYPNPFENFVVVEGAKDYAVVVNDIYGKQVNVTVLRDGAKATILTDNLAKGMYIITVNGNGFSGTQKIIKN